MVLNQFKNYPIKNYSNLGEPKIHHISELIKLGTRSNTYSINKYFVSTDYRPGTDLGPESTAVSKTVMFLALMEPAEPGAVPLGLNQPAHQLTQRCLH